MGILILTTMESHCRQDLQWLSVFVGTICNAYIETSNNMEETEMRKFLAGTVVGTALGMWVFASVLAYRTINDGLDITSYINKRWKELNDASKEQELRVNPKKRKYTVC